MNDIRIALRALAGQRAFTVAAILTLAIGIGANTAVFTVVQAVLLAPLPYTDADEIVVLNEIAPSFPNPISVSYQNYVDWRERNRSFETVAAFRTTQMTLTAAGSAAGVGGGPAAGPGARATGFGAAEAERLTARQITATLVPMLGVPLPLGRGFSEADDRPGAPGVAILSHGLWSRRFGARSDVIGQAVQLDQRPYSVIGVLPPSFELLQAAEVYVPLGPWAATLPDDRGWHPGILPVARLKDGVSIEQARGDMDRIARELEVEYPQFNREVRATVTPLSDQLVQNVRPALLMLSGAVVLVLLIACANVANLLLARAVDRQKEIAVRSALGAGRARLLRQLIVESIVLACVGGMGGMLVATWGVSLLAQLTTGLPRANAIEVDRSVLGFALAISVVTGLVFGIAPAIQATRLDIREALNEEGRGSGSGSIRHHRMRSLLVVAEVAMALVLLIGAGLLLRSFSALQRVDPGFDEQRLLVVDLPLSPVTYGENVARSTIVERIIERARALPGASNAAITTGLPMSGAGATIHFNIAGRPPQGAEDYKLAGYRAVSSQYFETLRVALLSGRSFSERDREAAPPVAIVNESMARQYFPDINPIGQRFAVGTEPDAESIWFEIVGVVADVKQSFEAGAKAEYYLPYGQYPHPVLAGMYRNVSLVVRSEGDPISLASSLRATLAEIDPEQPLAKLRTMEQAIGDSVAQPRLRTVLLTVFAIVAVVLAMSGVYGVMAYTVRQRTQEIGVRVALGASQADVVAMVVRQGAVLVVAGVAIGLAGAALAARVIEGMLFEMTGLDPVTFAAAALVLTGAAILASYLPARKAARVAPIVALGR
jgi:putative ABC transport system permease protein